MFRLILSITLVFLASISTHAQSVFENISLEDALSKAQREKKILFIAVEAKDCETCNQVANAAFEKPQLKQKLATECISLSVSPDQKLWLTLQKQYNTREGGIALFLDENGTLIHRYNGTASSADIYIVNIDMARSKLANGAFYRQVEQHFQERKNDPQVFENYLALRNNLGLDIDSLLNKYALLLSPDSAQSRRVLRFLVRLAPTLGSPADKVLRKNIALFNQAWMSLDQGERVAINNNIIRKSKQLAVKTRDINAAYRVATFAGSTHYDVNTAQRAYDQNMTDYFRETRDTVQYLEYATEFYDTYYMTISVDSIKKVDSLKMLEKRLATQNNALGSQAPGVRATTSIVFSPSTQIYTNQLAVAARTIYNFTKDTVYLQKAMEWAKRACEFYESPSGLDIYARLLFRLGQPAEAIKLEQRAVELGKSTNYPVTQWEDVLARMKKGQKNID